MLQHWPVQERPREKLLHLGAENLSDAELLAIFLRTGVKGCNVVDLSRQLLTHFGSINALYNADEHEFCQHKGLGQAKYVQLQACLEMAKRYLHEQINKSPCLTTSHATKQYMMSTLKPEKYEVFGILLLNNQHQIIQFERLFQGTINGATVYPRVVVEKVLQQNATAVVLAHNHPSGHATPSDADKQITQRLIKALALIDVRVLDHLIVAGACCYSFAEHGLI